MWKYFFLGLLVGWLVEWIIDWFYWRRGADPVAASSAMSAASAASAGSAASAASAAGTVEASRPRSGAAAEAVSRVAIAAQAAGAGDLAAGSQRGHAVSHPVARGGGVAVQAADATVYRPEDLEAVAGVGPKIGAMLRNNGITTFAELAVTPAAELERIVESTGEDPGGAGVGAWAEQARLAAAQDWEGLARLQDALQSADPDASAATAHAGVDAGAGVATDAGADRRREP